MQVIFSTFPWLILWLLYIKLTSKDNYMRLLSNNLGRGDLNQSGATDFSLDLSINFPGNRIRIAKYCTCYNEQVNVYLWPEGRWQRWRCYIRLLLLIFLPRTFNPLRYIRLWGILFSLHQKDSSVQTFNARSEIREESLILTKQIWESW